MKSFPLRAAGVAAAALALTAGCDNGRLRTAPVRGRLTFEGKPVPYGTVNFIPTSTNGPSATGDIGPDGSYKLKTYKPGDGAILGTHKVVIVAIESMGDRLPEDRTPLPPSIVPDKYSSVVTTDLTATVKDEDNQIDFDLKEDGKKRK